MRARGRLAKLTRLDVGELWMVAQLTWSIGWTQLLLRALPLPRVLALLDSPLTWPAGLGMSRAKGDPRRLMRLSKALLRQNVAIFRKNCLRQCLALYPLLRRAGNSVIFRLGVIRDADGFRAHSWLELDGRPFGEEADPYAQFHVIYSYPPPDGPSTDDPPPDENLWRNLT